MIESSPTHDHTDGVAWVAALRAGGPARSEAHRRLFELLLRAARFE